MKITVEIDDELYRQALEMADAEMNKESIFEESLRVFVRIQTAKRLIALGGGTPESQDVPRRRP
ncbi:DUF2191 domain-containing protein [Pseudomonas sp. 31-12]|uniref:DUF2191 domain-containing protein n=1 Tax=Pseudomonas sp. 31-12 TaxID=2201356 RepID=UPI000D6C87EC|nr:DUF2191 domain-containing protein [Pseudomonas sp. 31-12]AWM92488.1 DUF2191 domain-containing protein [Pseudomonas sp. 31-12]